MPKTPKLKQLKEELNTLRQERAERFRVDDLTSRVSNTNLGLTAATLALLKSPSQPGAEGIFDRVKDLHAKMGPVNGARTINVEVPETWDILANFNPYYDPRHNALNIPAHARDAVILHELGHAKNDAVMASKWAGKFHLPYRIIEMASRVGSGVSFLPTLAAAASQKETDLRYTPGIIQAILSSPMLAEEAAASARAAATLVQEHGALRGAAKALPLLPAIGTYATVAAAPLVVTYLRKRALAKKQALNTEKVKTSEAAKVEAALKEQVSTPEELEKKLKPGDVLFTAPNRKSLGYFWRYGYKPVSTAVQGTDYGHAALYVGGGKVMEARLGAPIKTVRLAKVVKHNNVVAFHPDVPKDERDQALEYAQQQKGVRFNVPAIVRAALPFRGKREGGKRPEEAPALICSALVANAYSRRKFSDSSRLMTRPSEIMDHEVMKPVAAVVRFNK